MGIHKQLLEEAKKQEEEAEQALACAKKRVRTTRLAVSFSRATREWLEKIVNTIFWYNKHGFIIKFVSKTNNLGGVEFSY